MKKVNIKTNKQKLPPSPDKWVGANPYKRLTIDIPADIHAQFKAKTASKRQKMAEVVLGLIKSYLKDG